MRAAWRPPTKAPHSANRRARRTKLARALPIAGLTAGLLAAPLAGHLLTTPAFAAECRPTRDPDGITYRNGTRRRDLYPTAVRANIRVKDTWVYDNTFAQSYVGFFNGDFSERASVGWIEFDSQHYHTQVRWTEPGGNMYTTFPPEPLESEPRYAVWESFTTNEYVFYVKGVEIDRKPLFASTADEARIYSATSTAATQMPGTPSTKEHMKNSELRIGTGSLENFNGEEVNSKPAWFGMEKVNGRHYDVWDKC